MKRTGVHWSSKNIFPLARTSRSTEVPGTLMVYSMSNSPFEFFD
ncbi:MAG TPA: hypothetical protein VN616_00515 [Puia sp.]|nr:hypothetical protein [Puia sp.]